MTLHQSCPPTSYTDKHTFFAPNQIIRTIWLTRSASSIAGLHRLQHQNRIIYVYVTKKRFSRFLITPLRTGELMNKWVTVVPESSADSSGPLVDEEHQAAEQARAWTLRWLFAKWAMIGVVALAGVFIVSSSVFLISFVCRNWTGIGTLRKPWPDILGWSSTSVREDDEKTTLVIRTPARRDVDSQTNLKSGGLFFSSTTPGEERTADEKISASARRFFSSSTTADEVERTEVISLSIHRV